MKLNTKHKTYVEDDTDEEFDLITNCGEIPEQSKEAKGE